MKTKKKKYSLYQKEEKNVDLFTFIIHILGLLLTIINIVYNYYKNLIESVYFGVFIVASLGIAMLVYFKYKQYLLGAFISVLGSTIGISGVLYFEGRLSLNFLYYFAIILSIPFLVKRDKSYVKDCYILFIIVAIIALTTLFVAPTNPTYPFLTIGEIYTKMLVNSTTSLLTVVMFTVIIVYVSRNFFISFLKDKKFAENEKDKRMVALTLLGHELRTQINSINGITQLIIEQKKESNPNKQLLKQYATILDKCNDQMLNLVNDVLDIHKIESSKFELIKKPENLDRLLSEICNKFNSLADEKELFFKKEIDPEITKLNLVFDKMRLNQILENLLRNAVKYTDEGEITLKVLLLKETSIKASVLFKVEDTGIGISEINHSKIFESFQQIKGENSDIYGGTGLGLSLTKTILEKMDSSIDIESNIKKGSIFSFKIDFSKTSQESKIQNIETVLNKNSSLIGKNILIADDNKVNLLYTHTLLKNHEAKTFLAKDGFEAIEIVKNNKEIDTVLLDLEMPKLNGFQAIEQIKMLNKELTVIAFTANVPHEELLNKLNSLGFDDFITKPFKKEELIKSIYLNRRKAIECVV